MQAHIAAGQTHPQCLGPHLLNRYNSISQVSACWRPVPERSCHSLMHPVASTSGRQSFSVGSQGRMPVATAAAVAERSAAAAPMTVVDVPLGDRSYPIYIGKGLLDRGDLLQQHIPGKRVLVVTNETIAPLYLQR